MPPHAHLVGDGGFFTCLKPLNLMTRVAIVTRPCFSYVEACVGMYVCELKNEIRW